MTPVVYASRADSNQAEIVEALRRAGCTVQPIHQMGHGVPDLLVAHHGTIYLLEVKSAHGELTADEAAWHLWWDATVYIVRSAEEALQAVGLVEYKHE